MRDGRPRQNGALSPDCHPHPTPLKTRGNNMMAKCFTCSQMDYFQQKYPHMECMWVGPLKEPQAARRGSLGNRIMEVVWVNGPRTWSLVDMGCGKMSVKKA